MTGTADTQHAYSMSHLNGYNASVAGLCLLNTFLYKLLVHVLIKPSYPDRALPAHLEAACQSDVLHGKLSVNLYVTYHIKALKSINHSHKHINNTHCCRRLCLDLTSV